MKSIFALNKFKLILTPKYNFFKYNIVNMSKKMQKLYQRQ